jgi:hypothetical protein
LSEEVKKKIKMFVKPFVHPCGWIKTYPRNVAEFPTDILAFAYNTDSVAVPCPLHVPDITYISGLKFMRSSAAELRAAESRHKHTGKPPTLQLTSDSSSSNSLEQMLGRAFQGMAMMQQHNHSQLAQLLGGQGERPSWTPAPTLPSLNDAPCPLGSLNTVQGDSATSTSVLSALQQGKMFTPRTKAPLAAIMGLEAQASTSDALVIPKQPQGPPPKQPQFGFSLPGHALIADAVQPPPDVMDADDVIDGMAEKIPETPNATDTELDPLQELLQATSAAMHSSNKPAKQPPTGPDAKPKTTRQKIAAMAKVNPPKAPTPVVTSHATPVVAATLAPPPPKRMRTKGPPPVVTAPKAPPPASPIHPPMHDVYGSCTTLYNGGKIQTSTLSSSFRVFLTKGDRVDKKVKWGPSPSVAWEKSLGMIDDKRRSE